MKLIQHISTRFGFMDPPKPERVFYALKRLRKLGALDQEDKITNVGNIISNDEDDLRILDSLPHMVKPKGLQNSFNSKKQTSVK